jgi:uncharacterized protein with HEPN domain
MKNDAALLLDMVIAARDIEEFIGEMDRERFIASALVRAAVIRQLEVIGEAVKRLSEEFRESQPAIPWSRIAGMRDRLIHGYDDIDVEIVWRVAKIETPKLLAQLGALIPDSDR